MNQLLFEDFILALVFQTEVIDTGVGDAVLFENCPDHPHYLLGLVNQNFILF